MGFHDCHQTLICARVRYNTPARSQAMTYLCLPRPLVHLALLDDAVELEATVLRDRGERVQGRQLLISERPRMGGNRQAVGRANVSRSGDTQTRGGDTLGLGGPRDVGHGCERA